MTLMMQRCKVDRAESLRSYQEIPSLADPKQAIPPYDAVLLLAPRRAHDAALQAALKPPLGGFDVATMREANLRASGSDADSSLSAVAR
ncbi:osmoprotectant transport system permease protein [Bradyrhizobium sp. Rc2d]|uniref:hypothetical protein n=1 Tax=Bradyrhizobium sp. Rc2d TaxID=1855321 RepID=UPI00087E752A|nr:hypothetical protein [Bradyrhizobium sp. Rc2d]SDH45745.1 osmoprotectant transport system permease protein [Bradyrhizobium sp. Rc2d]